MKVIQKREVNLTSRFLLQWDGHKFNWQYERSSRDTARKNIVLTFIAQTVKQTVMSSSPHQQDQD